MSLMNSKVTDKNRILNVLFLSAEEKRGEK
jgi:hypothetical protein